MNIRIPASDFHQFTGDPFDQVTELVVQTNDEIITVKAGKSVLHLTRDQVKQLNECFLDWLSGYPDRKWSDFWTMSLK